MGCAASASSRPPSSEGGYNGADEGSSQKYALGPATTPKVDIVRDELCRSVNLPKLTSSHRLSGVTGTCTDTDTDVEDDESSSSSTSGFLKKAQAYRFSQPTLASSTSTRRSLAPARVAWDVDNDQDTDIEMPERPDTPPAELESQPAILVSPALNSASKYRKSKSSCSSVVSYMSMATDCSGYSSYGEVGGGNGMEWMYELEAKEKWNPFSEEVANHVFHADMVMLSECMKKLLEYAIQRKKAKREQTKRAAAAKKVSRHIKVAPKNLGVSHTHKHGKSNSSLNQDILALVEDF
eukprot:Hpha_TRINITY_DN15903_c6_g4::TRINITY_DN15903_c6_g4_i1::g.73552::m.73552